MFPILSDADRAYLLVRVQCLHYASTKGPHSEEEISSILEALELSRDAALLEAHDLLTA